MLVVTGRQYLKVWILIESPKDMTMEGFLDYKKKKEKKSRKRKYKSNL